MLKPLCISTLDLGWFQRGGVVALALRAAQMARDEGWSPFFVTPCFDLHRTLRRSVRGGSPGSSRMTLFEDVPCRQMGALFPEFEFNAHRFRKLDLREALPPSVRCLAVSGNNHAARPFLDRDLPFGLWIATTFWEDCRDRLARTPWNVRKALDVLSLPVCRRLERRIFQKARRIAVISRYTRDLVLALEPAWADKTDVIPVPVDCGFFRPAESLEKRNELVFIGRILDPRKNVDALLEAFGRAGKILPELKLVLIGAGDEAVADRVTRHPLGERIRWIARVTEEEKRAHLQRALALVIPSWQEGFGITGAEALACGTPVLSTPCGGPQDFVVDGETGLLLKGFGAEEMAAAILRCAGDEGLRDRLGRQGRAFAEAHLSLEAVRPKLRALLHAIGEGR